MRTALRHQLPLLALAVTLPLLQAQTPHPANGTIHYDQTTDTYTFSWQAQPGYYYFIDQSTDLSTPWNTVDLLTDLDTDGQLTYTTLGTPTGKLFFQLEGINDIHDTRLRADNDGDKIINIDDSSTFSMLRCRFIDSVSRPQKRAW